MEPGCPAILPRRGLGEYANAWPGPGELSGFHLAATGWAVGTGWSGGRNEAEYQFRVRAQGSDRLNGTTYAADWSDWTSIWRPRDPVAVVTNEPAHHGAVLLLDQGITAVPGNG